MNYAAKNLMIPISNQLKKIIYEEVVGPVYNENFRIWLIAIRVLKPICGSIEIRLTQPQNEEFPILSLEVYCEKDKEMMREVFIKIIKLIDNKIYKINTSENFIGLHWQVNFISENKKEIDLKRLSRLLPRILIILKDLGLFRLKSFEEIKQSIICKFNRNDNKKILIRKTKVFLIRNDCPVIFPSKKSYFYYN